ncbi:MAG TPA: EAL domain-containing protein, partial [Dokdonella sp.]
ELTESSALQNPAIALDVLARFRLKGFALSIDDFGTGYSTMTQLAQLPVSEIKIDRSFVAAMAESIEAAKIVEFTIRLARGLGLTTVAEGVDNADTLTALEALGCDLAQGFLIAPPMEGASASRWLLQWEAGAE